MPAFIRSGWIIRLGIGALAAVSLAGISPQPTAAQTRTLAGLADVPVFVPAPHHPHQAIASYSAAMFDSHPYYGGAYNSGGVHYWH